MSETDFFGLLSTVARRWEPYVDDGGALLGHWCLDHRTDATECRCLPRLEIPTVWPTLVTKDAANIGGPGQGRRHTLPLNYLLGGVPNPNWLEWYMGLPASWTDPESTPEATEWFQQWQDEHSYIFSPSWWGIPRLHEIPRAQLRKLGVVYDRALTRRKEGLDPVQVVRTEDQAEQMFLSPEMDDVPMITYQVFRDGEWVELTPRSED